MDAVRKDKIVKGILPDGKAQVTVEYEDGKPRRCLLYTSDAADDLLCVDLGGRRIIKKKNKYTPHAHN